MRSPTLWALLALPALGQNWPQWGQNPQHTGWTGVAGQTPSQILQDIISDPFVRAEQADGGGDLLAHYQAAIVDGDDVFMLLKTGGWVPCDPPGTGNPYPCGANAWNSQIWNEVRLHWENGALVEKWRFASAWKPTPNAGGLGGWEPVFHPVLAGGYLYIPGPAGAVSKVNREDGSLVAWLSPSLNHWFDGPNLNAYVAGPLTVDNSGNVYYSAIALNPSNPWGMNVASAWLVKIGADDSIRIVDFASLVPGAPAAVDGCFTSFDGNSLPWPPSPDAVPPKSACGSQRPGLNIAPSVAPDGTVYIVSRAHLNSRYSYLVAVNPDLTPKWSASLRDRLSDGCGGTTSGCREGAAPGVDPATNQPPAGRVIDSASSSPVVAPDGSVLYGAYTAYNYQRGHLFHFSANGDFLNSYNFGWDTTPAVYAHDGTYSVILKDNHYETGSYCGDPRFCPVGAPGPYLITQLDAALKPEWTFQNSNTRSCARRTDGSLTCVSDHPGGFEWCVNAAAVDVNGSVYANSEDGNLYVIGQGGTLRSQLFLNLALGAAYTPISIGPDGKIYAQNDGHLLVVGQPPRQPPPVKYQVLRWLQRGQDVDLAGPADFEDRSAAVAQDIWSRGLLDRRCHRSGWRHTKCLPARMPDRWRSSGGRS